MNKKYVELLKNIFFLFIGNFGSKVLVFFLLPLYTSILTPEEYGTYDLLYTAIVLLIPILTLNIAEAALRFSLDEELDTANIFSISFRYLLKSILIILSIVLLNFIFGFSLILKDNSINFVLLYISNLFYVFFSNYIRGLNLISSLSISGILNTILLVISNVLFLKIIPLGFLGYFYANILSFMLPSVYMMVKCYKSGNLYLQKDLDSDLQNQMVNYSSPLIFNAIGWWINSASDRYIVAAICGTEMNGLYSVGYKIPSILNILSSIFNQAWVISSSKNVDDEHGDAFFRQIYIVYNTVLVLGCSLLISMTKFFAHFLYLNSFYTAWVFVPFLILSTVFGALSGFAGGIFSAKRNSKIFSSSTIFGAVVNIVLNILLVSYFGPIGAAFSTLVSYFIIWWLRIRYLFKVYHFKVSYQKDLIVYGILLIQCFLFINIQHNILLYVSQLLCFLAIVFLSRKPINILLQKTLSLLSNKFNSFSS